MWPVPRKQLRGNWSSRIISASAPSASSIQSSSSRRAAAKCRSRKRSRKSASKASSLGTSAPRRPRARRRRRRPPVGSIVISIGPSSGAARASTPAVSSFSAWPGRRGGASGAGTGDVALHQAAAGLDAAGELQLEPLGVAAADILDDVSATSSASTPSASASRRRRPAPIRRSRASGSRRRP